MSGADVVGLVALLLGIIAFTVRVVVSLSNRAIREERIQHLEGMVKSLREDLMEQEDRCKEDLQAMKVTHARLQGQVDALSDGLGEKIATAVVKAVVHKMPPT